MCWNEIDGGVCINGGDKKINNFNWGIKNLGMVWAVTTKISMLFVGNRVAFNNWLIFIIILKNQYDVKYWYNNFIC